jgi:biopolymer transport protein ExbB
MKKKIFARRALYVLCGLATILFAPPSFAQAPAPSPAPAISTPAERPAALPPPSGQAATQVDDAGRPLVQTGRMQRDLSPWSMFATADILVKAVIISLGLASLATWTIFLAKTLLLSRALRGLRKALARIAETRTLAEAQLALGTTENVLSSLLTAAFQEVRLSGDSGADEGIKERAASRFSEIARAEARSMRQGMTILATIGATSPFVGLFGTVWGIMNSFIGISKAQTTNLAVVAPGIAEALLATAVGLVAAIPAVMIYNYFSRSTKGYLELVGRGSGAVGRLLSRDLDRVRGRLITRAAE